MCVIKYIYIYIHTYIYIYIHICQIFIAIYIECTNHFVMVHDKYDAHNLLNVAKKKPGYTDLDVTDLEFRGAA